MLKGIIEALLFITDEPLSAKKLQQLTGQDETEIQIALSEIQEDLENNDRGFLLQEIAGGWRFYSNPDYAAYVERLVLSSEFRRLTHAALETMAIVAYKQPITRADISAIRGVSVDSVLANLVAKGLLREVGKEPTPGHPTLYGTTDRFLESFGLNDLTELPPLSEFEPDEDTANKIRKNLQSEPS